jgi:hypothetical protein
MTEPTVEAGVGGERRLGYWAALVISPLTVVAFALALTATPNAGRNCTRDCVTYPFTGPIVARQWPGDYLWMYPAMLVMLVFVALVASVHERARPQRKVFSLLGLCFAAISAAVLVVDYFIQVTVMPQSLAKGQLDGFSLFTQYNPNGVFVALEELGYLLMSCALLCVATVFSRKTRCELAIRWLLYASFAAMIIAFIAVSAVYGTDRQDAFEIPAISIVWVSLIVAGPVLAIALKRDVPGE